MHLGFGFDDMVLATTGAWTRARAGDFKDAGTTRVVAPTGMVDSGAVVAPQVMVRNFGINTISFPPS